MRKDDAVLLIDDSREMREMVKAVLTREGLFGRYYEAGDGEEAMALLNSNTDVVMVLMDLFMPKVGGIEVIKWLRDTHRYKDMPVLVLTVDGRKDLKVMSLKMGATDYMVKPFDVDELIERVRLLFERKQLSDELKRKDDEIAALKKGQREFAVTDELTNVFNSQHFFKNLTNEMKRCVRHKMPMTLMLVNIDDFSPGSNTLGPDTGAEVIKSVAGILGGNLRECDVVGRYGEEEFITYLVHTGLEDAVVPAERIRSIVENTAFAFPDSTYRATVSIGMAGFPGVMPESCNDFVAKASMALTEAKNTGKNRIVANYC